MRYLNIIDIREFDCYSNVNCRIVYIEVACRMDTQSRNLKVSVRKLASDLGLTYNAVRHALSMLERDGLICNTTTQEATQEATQRATQSATHLHVVSFNELQHANNAANNAESNAESNAVSNDLKNNNYNNNNIYISHTHACEVLRKIERDKMCYVVDIAERRCNYFMRAFLQTMVYKGKRWISEEDLVAHCFDWCVKNKKTLIAKMDAEEAAEAKTKAAEANVRTAAAAAAAPVPSGMTHEQWMWVCKMVRIGDCAPEVREVYNKGIAELKNLDTKKAEGVKPSA